MDVRNLWLPDVFGYSAAMPQIIRKAGCDWFLTQKISWSQFNKFPYHTFHWRGIDGTEVLTHFPPEDNYNSALKPEQLNYAVNNFNENYFLPEFITLFGVGDGGGGPRPEHIEHGLRTADLEGCPQVRFDRADAFFARLAEHAGELPEWAGELYLELHRGTLTTQARTKRNNRKCEQMLAQTEFICSVLPAADYPAETLDRLWKVLLINQFHDIIPGSSIRKVYEVTEAEHAMILAECENLVRSAAAKLTAPDGDALTVVNTLSYDYTGAVAAKRSRRSPRRQTIRLCWRTTSSVMSSTPMRGSSPLSTRRPGATSWPARPRICSRSTSTSRTSGMRGTSISRTSIRRPLMRKG